MKKLYIILGLVALMVLVFVVFKLNSSHSTISTNIAADNAVIKNWTKLELAYRGDTSVLELKGDKWYVGKSDQNVDIARLVALRDFVYKLPSKNPVTGPLGEELKSSISQKGFSFKGFDRDKCTYQLSYDTINGGLYAYSLNSKYVNELYYDANDVDKILTASPQLWSESSMFTFDPNNFKKLICEWGDSTKSFKIVRLPNNSLEVRTRYAQTCNNDILKFYIAEYSKVHFYEADNIDKLTKYCTINVEKATGDFETVEFYHKSDNQSYIEGYTYVYNTQLNKWGKIPYLQISPILRKASFFIKK